MVKATTGGGIVMLMSAAKILNKAIYLALKAEKFTSKFFAKYYQRPFRKTLGRELKIHFIIRLILMTLEPEDYRQFFSLYNNTPLKIVIQNYADMDFPLLLVGKLLKEPRFLAFVFHLFFRRIYLIPKVVRALVL
jgi:flavin-dependent dehydrogenase